MSDRWATLLLAGGLLVLVGCKGFEQPQNQRLSNHSPQEAEVDEPQAIDREKKGEELSDALAAEQATDAYNKAGRAHLDGELRQAKRHLHRALKLNPGLEKARALLSQINAQLQAGGEGIPPERKIAIEKAQVEIRRRMKLARELLGRREFQGADEEYQLALRASRQLPEGLSRTTLQYRLRALRTFTRRMAAESGKPLGE